MPRLIYGILALILGSMALLLPETKKHSLPRTMIQVEVIPTSVSNTFRRRRAAPTKPNAPTDNLRPEATGPFSDAASVVSGGVRSFRPYDHQSTLHSVYELQEFEQDDTIHSITNRIPSRRADSRNTALYQPYNNTNNNHDLHRQESIREDAEYDEDLDDDRTRFSTQFHLNEQQKQLSRAQTPVPHTLDDVVILETVHKGRPRKFSLRLDSPLFIWTSYDGSIHHHAVSLSFLS